MGKVPEVSDNQQTHLTKGMDYNRSIFGNDYFQSQGFRVCSRFVAVIVFTLHIERSLILNMNQKIAIPTEFFSFFFHFFKASILKMCNHCFL